MALHQDRSNAQLIGMRCERGAQIAQKIGLGQKAAEAIRSLDEHWDGTGHPDRLVGETIPLLARILNVAQHLDLFAGEQGQDAALDVILERSGLWFDPEIVRVVQLLAKQNLLWQDYGSSIERDIVREMEPGYALEADERQIDNISEAFADIVDAKSSFTFQHSLGVTKAALRIAYEFNFTPQRRTTIYRASLLHDLGKLRVSNSILDKTTKPDEREWEIIREHPGLTRQILEKIGAFSEIAVIAGNHHEKLDGSGYPLNLSGHEPRNRTSCQGPPGYVDNRSDGKSFIATVKRKVQGWLTDQRNTKLSNDTGKAAWNCFAPMLKKTVFVAINRVAAPDQQT